MVLIGSMFRKLSNTFSTLCPQTQGKGTKGKGYTDDLTRAGTQIEQGKADCAIANV